MIDTDACTNACLDAVCGDGIVQEGVEECDDGNMVDDDACASCSITMFSTCENGQIDPPEICLGQATTVLSSQPIGVAIHDVTGDDNADVIVLRQAGNRLVAHVGDGTGSVDDVTTSPTLGSSLRGLALVDFTPPQGDFGFLTATGDGKLLRIPVTGNANDPFGSVAEYVSCNMGDGLAVAAGEAWSEGTVSPLLASSSGGEGRLSWYDPATPALCGQGVVAEIASPGALTLANVNGVGAHEVVIVGQPGAKLGVYRIMGGSLVALSVSPNIPALGSTPTGVAAGDFDGDAADDVAVVGAVPSCDPLQPDACMLSRIQVFFGDPAAPETDMSFSFKSSVEFVTGKQPQAILAVDVNADGNLDLVTANSVSDDVSVLRGRGDGTFGPAIHFPLGAGPSNDPRFLAAGDLNADSYMDIVVAEQSWDAIRILVSNP